MEEIKKPLLRKSVRADTLSNTSFLNSFILGQAVRKRTSKTRTKVELSPEHIDINNLMGEATGYILKSAESTIATPFFITVLAFSTDEDVIMFGSSNGNISRYDTKESKIIDDIPLNIGKINSIDLDKDFNIAAVVGETPIIRIYKLPRFELEFELVGHSSSINKVILNPESKSIFSCSDDFTVKMWDLSQKCEKATIIKHFGMCKSLVLSKCGNYVFSGGEDCLIRVFDLGLNEEVLNLKSHIGCVWSLSVNKKSTLLASGGSDKLVIVWNILDFTPMHVFEEHLGTITTLKFTNDGAFLISGSEDNSMKVWDLEKERREITLNAHTAPVREVIISRYSDYIVSCSDDKSLKIWSFPEFMEENNFKVLNNDFNSVIEAGYDIVSCGSDHHIRFWNREKDEAGIIFKTHGVGLKCCMSYDNKYLAVGDDYGYLYVFDQEYNYIKDFQAHKGPIRDMVFLHSGELVTGGGDSIVTIWNLGNWESKQLRGHQQSIWCLAYSSFDPKSELLASGSGDKTIRAWDLTNLTEILLFQTSEQPTSLYFTNDGRYIISGSMQGTISIWSISEKIEESVFSLHTDMVTGIHITDDCETMLSVSKDCSIHFLSLKYRIPISFITRKQPILCLALISENSTIITGEHQLIYLQDNPLVSNRIRILGPEDNVQKFLTYMKNIVSGKFIQHDLKMDKFMILPFFFNTLHFYSFLGLRDHLLSSLVETATIYPSKNGYHPLYIALIKGMKGIRDDIIDALINLGATNPFLFQSLENVIIKMNTKAFPKLGELYEAIYQPVLRISLPKFCSPDIELPIVNITDHPRIRINDFFANDDVGNHGQGILFKESYVKIDYVMGSKESIEFLESLASCTNLDVMRSTLIQAMIAYKWENSRFPMMIQGVCYYVYLFLLTCFTTFALGDPWFELALFFVNTLLLVYELFQMSVSGSFYFRYLWNYIDWIRGITLYCYILCSWLNIMSEYSNSIFSLTVFVSFSRGISYFRLFKFTRYLINLLFQVISDILGFFILLAYSTVAFCFLFIVLNRNSNACDFEIEPDCELPETTFSSYLMGSYNLVLGAFDAEAEYNMVEYTCLTFALLINPIIMLNLLISIIGDTYDRVQSDNLSADMKETLDMIQEVENMMFFRRNRGKKMFFQECTEYEKTDQEAGWEGKLRALEGTINKIQERNTENHGVLMKKIKTQDKIMETLSEKIDLVLKKLQSSKENEKSNEKKLKKPEKKELK